jgi:hypothetical protein
MTRFSQPGFVGHTRFTITGQFMPFTCGSVFVQMALDHFGMEFTSTSVPPGRLACTSS